MRNAKSLLLNGLLCAALLVPAQSFAQNLWVLRGFNNSDDPFRVVGRGYVSLGDPDVDVDAWYQQRRFCDENYEENEALCSGVPDSITAYFDVEIARFTIYGHTFVTEDFVWSYNYDRFSPGPSSIYVQMGEEGGPFLWYASNTEDFGFGYSVNGHGPLGSPYCDNHLCESFYWGDELPLWAVPEPATLTLFALSLGAMAFVTQRRRKAA